MSRKPLSIILVAWTGSMAPGAGCTVGDSGRNDDGWDAAPKDEDEESKGDGDGGEDENGEEDEDGGEDGNGEPTEEEADAHSDDPTEDLPILSFMEPSFAPPGGLTASQVPQFIVFGFDDNRFEDGMEWVLDTFAEYRNPEGAGNARTYDGRRARVSFYYTTDSLEMDGGALEKQWLRAGALGHEVGNHTHTHRVTEDITPLVVGRRDCHLQRHSFFTL
ncbi:MAG: hypothetical protein V3V08_06370 [Nannocystaceae bacterium]